MGLLIGIGAYTFVYAKGYSYISNDPSACANCHVMNDQYSGWMKSGHRHVAVCNDCHTPPGIIPKYFTKALNGWNHSWAFTTGRFPDNIRITARNYSVTEQACRKCHLQVTSEIEGHREQTSCVRCHWTVGHQ